MGGWILLILSNTQYFRGVKTPYIKQYAVFSWGSILLVLNTQYFWGADTPCIKQYVVFSCGRLS